MEASRNQEFVDLNNVLPMLSGVLYVIEFTGKLVKIGYSKTPKQRLSDHIETAVSLENATPIRAVISYPHYNFMNTEALLIEHLGKPVYGNEWHRGGYTKAVKFIKSLDLQTVKVEKDLVDLEAFYKKQKAVLKTKTIKLRKLEKENESLKLKLKTAA